MGLFQLGTGGTLPDTFSVVHLVLKMRFKPCNHSIAQIHLIPMAPREWRMTFAFIFGVHHLSAEPSQVYEHLVPRNGATVVSFEP